MCSRRLLSLLITVFIFAGLSIPAQACTAIYAGSEMTDTGDTVFGRIEDFSSDYPKRFDAGTSQSPGCDRLFQNITDREAGQCRNPYIPDQYNG